MSHPKSLLSRWFSFSQGGICDRVYFIFSDVHFFNQKWRSDERIDCSAMKNYGRYFVEPLFGSESLASYANCLQMCFTKKHTILLNNLNTTLITRRKRFGWQNIQFSMQKHRILSNHPQPFCRHTKKKKTIRCTPTKGGTSAQTAGFGGFHV